MTTRIRGAVLAEIGAERPYRTSSPLQVVDLDLDDPGADELLVRIEAAGLCHSDLSVIDGNRVRPTPMLLGHEAAGIVEQVGERAAQDGFAIGDRVVMAFLPRCGECAGCRTDGIMPCVPGTAANNAGELLSGGSRLHLADSGEPVFHHLGVSGFATHAVVDRRSAVVVGADVPPEVAAVLGCAVLTGGGAVVNAGGARPGQDIAIVGLGGVGMAALVTAVSLGHGRVIGVDGVRSKLDRARELGADLAVTPEEAADQGIRVPLVVEAAGHPRAFRRRSPSPRPAVVPSRSASPPPRRDRRSPRSPSRRRRARSSAPIWGRRCPRATSRRMRSCGERGASRWSS